MLRLPCSPIAAPSTLARYRSGNAPATLGNHTATHLSLDAAGANDIWWQDVEGCHRRLSELSGAPVRYFRFPYLRYGQSAESHADAARKLDSLGYQVAHVTAATSEWLLADYYQAALAAHDEALTKELTQAYVEHLVDSLQAARQLALAKVGHDVAQITLFHVNRLAADHVGDVLRALTAHGWAFVSLQEALSDPVYSRPDAYRGPCGCSWLSRIAPAVKRGDGYVFGDYEDQIRARFDARVVAIRNTNP